MNTYHSNHSPLKNFTISGAVWRVSQAMRSSFL